MNTRPNEQIAPEIAQALIGRAASHGLSINDYLRQMLGLTYSPDTELALDHQMAAPRNEAMFAVLQETADVLKDMPISGSTEDSLKILHEGRAGRMYGYEPAE
ncbi:MAG: hypothetical protein ABIU20_00160 [Blastocatellia bacterium]